MGILAGYTYRKIIQRLRHLGFQFDRQAAGSHEIWRNLATGKNMFSSSHENFTCPYCGEENGVVVDAPTGGSQSFVQDCEVCCRPIAIRLRCRGGKIVSIEVRRENE